MSEPSVTDQATSGFEATAAAVLRQLQMCFAEIFHAVPSDLGRPQQVGTSLGVDRNLAWQVTRVVQSTNLFAIAQYLPGRAAVQRFFRAAERVGVPDALISAANDSLERFEEFTRIHAGDRTTLDMMLNSLAEEERLASDLVYRRMAYRGNSYIWGSQVRTQLKLAIAQPSDDPSLMDVASINTYFKIRRLRETAQVAIARPRASIRDTADKRFFQSVPIDASDPHGTGIYPISEFCTNSPRLDWRTVETDDSHIYYELLASGVGDTAAFTFVEGSLLRSTIRRYREENYTTAEASANICLPTETFVLDIALREDSYGRIEPRALVTGELFGRAMYPALIRDSGLLDVPTEVNYLGRGSLNLQCRDFPRYPKLVRHVFDSLKWDIERFDVYRCQIEYPVAQSHVTLRFDMPAPPP